MMGRLFWKTWASLWLVLLTTLALAGYIVEQLATVDAHEAARHRPWQTIESLAMEAERVAERGGDLGAWSRSDTATRLGTVYLLDANGDALGGGMLPEALGQASLRPFARAAGDDAGEGGFSTESTRALARTVFAPGQAEPYTLVFIPDAGERWSHWCSCSWAWCSRPSGPGFSPGTSLPPCRRSFTPASVWPKEISRLGRDNSSRTAATSLRSWLDASMK